MFPVHVVAGIKTVRLFEDRDLHGVQLDVQHFDLIFRVCVVVLGRAPLRLLLRRQFLAAVFRQFLGAQPFEARPRDRHDDAIPLLGRSIAEDPDIRVLREGVLHPVSVGFSDPARNAVRLVEEERQRPEAPVGDRRQDGGVVLPHLAHERADGGGAAQGHVLLSEVGVDDPAGDEHVRFPVRVFLRFGHRHFDPEGAVLEVGDVCIDVPVPGKAEGLQVLVDGFHSAEKVGLDAHGANSFSYSTCIIALRNVFVYNTFSNVQEGTTMKQVPSMDQWLKEAKADETAAKCGMYLVHNGVVREDAKAKVRGGDESAPQVTGMTFSYDKEKVDAAIEETYNMPGIYYIRTWLAEGELEVGDDIMYVLIGGDIRPHVVDALQSLVGTIKNTCVVEQEHH